MASQTKTSRIQQKKQFVLLVSNDACNASSVAALVKRFGYQVLYAAGEREALAAISVFVPSLIIICLDSDYTNSFELMRRLRQERSIAHVPFLVVAEKTSVNLKMLCAEHGAVACLSQPVDAESLYGAIQAAIEKTPRASIRVRTVLPVKVYGMPHDTLYGAYALALSTGGMFLRTMSPVSVNTAISVEFDLNGRSISAESLVVYNRQGSEGQHQESGIGLRFVDIAHKDREIIRAFIKNEVLKDAQCESN